jgi:2-iminobutanoate/2-iminopropanoate deaminase
MEKQVIVPDEKGRLFARSLRVGQFLFISGMTGQWDLKTWEYDARSKGDISFQTRRSLEWMQQVLAASGLTMKDVVKTTTYVRDINDLPAIAEVKKDFWPLGDVTSTSIAVSGFVGAGDLEIDGIAVFPEGT